METASAQLSYTAYTAGTQQWVNAIRTDYERNLITSTFMQSALSGYVDPTTGAMLAKQPTLIENLLSGIGDTAHVLGTVWAKHNQLELEKAQNEFRLQAARNSLVGGMAGEGLTASYGGINVYTLAMFAGAALLAMLLLKKA